MPKYCDTFKRPVQLKKGIISCKTMIISIKITVIMRTF